MLLVWFLNVTAVWCRDGSPCWNAMFAFPHAYRGPSSPQTRGRSSPALRADAVTVTHVFFVFYLQRNAFSCSSSHWGSRVWPLLLTSWMFVQKRAVLAETSAHMHVWHFCNVKKKLWSLFYLRASSDRHAIQTQECDRSEITYYIWL